VRIAWRLEKRPAASDQSIQPETLSLMGPAARSGRPIVASGVQPQWSTWREALAIVCFRPHLRKTVLIALIVGSVIFSINQLDAVLQHTATTVTYLKGALTYLVPFGVSNYGLLMATRRGTAEG